MKVRPRNAQGKIRLLLLFVLVALGIGGAAVMGYVLLKPPMHEVFFDRAQSYAANDQWQEALEEYSKAGSEAALSNLETAPAIRAAAIRGAADILSLRMGKLDDAAKRYWELVELPGASDETREYALRRMFELYRDFSVNCRLALPFITRYMERFPTGEAAPLLKRDEIRCLLGSGELVQARVEADAFLKQWPGHALRFDVLSDKGTALFSGEHYDEAMKVYAQMQADSSAPEKYRGDAMLMRGRCLLETGYFEKAIEALKEALKATDRPAVVQVYLNAARDAWTRALESQQAKPKRVRGHPPVK